jgi:hypothetical protein
LVWIIVTFLTKPEPQATLLRFYERVRPHPAGWRPIVADARTPVEGESFSLGILAWFAGCGLVYGTLFGIGKLLFGEIAAACAWLALAAACAIVIFMNNPKQHREEA